MREFDFYGSWRDSFEILGAILDTGKASAFFDGPYMESKAKFYDELTPELQARLSTEGGGVYLWLPSISTLPLRFGRWESGSYAGQYYVTSGGPYLSLSFPACYIEGPEGPRLVLDAGENIRLGVGTLSCPHEFYVPDPGIVVKMPKAAQERDEEFRKIIKAHCRRFGPNKRWVGRHAIRLLEEGKAEVVSPGYYMSRARKSVPNP